jgi:hypothetical protein
MDNDKMRIFKLSDNEIVNHKMGVKSWNLNLRV